MILSKVNKTIFTTLCIVCLVSVSGFTFAQKINKKDDQGKKQGHWIYFGKDRPGTGFPDEGKVEEGDYKDDRKEGVWIKYHLDGKTPKLKGEYENNRPKGNYTKYHENGQVKEDGRFERDVYLDTLKRFHENGQLEYIAKFNNSGKEEGKVTYYYANGQEEFVYFSNNGKPSGKATRYYPNGDVKEIITFNADGGVDEGGVVKKEPVRPMVTVEDPGASKVTSKPVVSPIVQDNGGKFNPNGYNKVYNKNRDIYQDGIFKDGRLFDGKLYVYDSDGILLKVQIYKEGKYHSDGVLN